jgi:hypothetical protein
LGSLAARDVGRESRQKTFQGTVYNLVAAKPRHSLDSSSEVHRWF